MTRRIAGQCRIRTRRAAERRDTWIFLFLSMLLASCSMAPLDPDLVTCQGTPASGDPRYAELARTHVKELLATQEYALTVSNCWERGINVTERIAACNRAIGSGRLSTQNLMLALDCRGNGRIGSADFDQAIADHTEAIRLDPYNADLYSDRGTAWIVKGEIDRGIADYNEAIRLQPKSDVLYSNRAAGWLAKGDYDRAISDTTWALGFERRIAPAFANRGLAWSGNAWRKKGDNDLAIADYGEALRLDPHAALAYFNRAAVWRAKGDFDRANADINEAIRIEPHLATSKDQPGTMRRP